MNRMFPAFHTSRMVIAALPFAALLLLAAVPMEAAKNPDKPEKPDKTERPDKFDRATKKAEKRERAAFMASTDLPENADRRDRSDRGGRAPNGGSPVRSERSAAPSASVPSAAPDAQFDAFRLIIERNIFNPNRIGRTRPEDEVRPPRVDVIALVGTMQSEKGTVAFFDSPDPTFRKTLSEGQSVGGFKVERIAPDGVDLSGGPKPVSLKVAQELRRPEGGEWSVRATEPPRSPSGTPLPRESVAAAQPATPPPIPPDASDALRRLMEQRQKQLKQ